MTVAELIAKLQTHPQDRQVCLSGYEGGYYYPDMVKPISLLLDCNGEWWYGPHELDDEYNRRRFTDKTIVDAIHIT